MAQPSLQLVVDVNAPDQATGAGSGSSMPLRHSDFLAHGIDPASGQKVTYVHANILARVMQGGTDVSRQHRLWRRARYWEIRNNNPGTFGGLTKATDCSQDWFDDNRGGSGLSDAPGQSVPSGRGMSGFQMLYEFVVFIDRHQASTTGGYFFLIFSIDRNSYEVIRSNVLPVSFGQWPGIQASPKPWMIGKGMVTQTSRQLPRP